LYSNDYNIPLPESRSFISQKRRKILRDVKRTEIGLSTISCGLEDSANWAYDPVKQEPSADWSHNVSYLDRIMREFDMGDRWIYRNEPDAARAHARTYFDAAKVCAELLE